MYSYKLTLASFIVAVYLQLLLPVAGFAATITSTNSGGSRNWTDPDTWVNGSVPTSNDAVIITSGTSVTIDADLTLQSLTISGALTFETTAARIVTISGDVLINSGGSFQTGNAANIIDSLSISGDLTNNGILDFSTTTTTGAGIVFTGANNNTFGGNGTKTDILRLTINKGTNRIPVLTLNPTTFTIKGLAVTSQPFLNLLNGTIHISGTFSLSSPVINRPTSNYVLCDSTAGFWLDNLNFTVKAATVGVKSNGLLKIEQGIFNIGTGATDHLYLQATSDFIMYGGTLNIASKLSATVCNNFSVHGGTINVCIKGNSTASPSFEVNANTFTISGGNIVLNKVSSAIEDYFGNGTVINITGGTLFCPTTGKFGLGGATPAITINGTNTLVILEDNIDVYGDITIGSGDTLNLNNHILYLDNGNIVNNGIIKAPFTSSVRNSQLWLNGNSAQTYSGTGSFGTLTEPIASIIINNEHVFNISSLVNNLNINNLYIYAGDILTSNKLAIGNSIALVSLIQYGSNGTATDGGTLDVAPTFNIGSGGLAILYCNESNERTTGVEIPSNRTIKQLIVISNTVHLSGGDLNVSTYLQFSSGKINLGNNHLILESNVSVTGADNNGYVVTNGTGRLTRKFVGSTKTEFPVGTTTTYDPVSITNAGTTDDFSVNVSSTLDAFSPMPNKYIQRQWNISEATTGGSDVTLSLTCAAGVPTNHFDAASAVEMGHYKSNNVWERIPATMSNSVATASNITSFSRFVIINQNAVLPVELVDFKGVANGKQNRISWSTASEQNTKYFILERRNNYGDFKSLDLVAATGQSNQPQFYQWVDQAPTPLSVYRLKIIDLNDSYEYSKVISVENAGGNAMTMLTHFTNNEWSVRLTDVPMGAGKISIFDMQGKLQYIQNIDIQDITTDIKLSINNLPNGSYVLVCNVAGQMLSKKWIKI
jgi:hypothetical protein